jgi:hypothetical protein
MPASAPCPLGVCSAPQPLPWPAPVLAGDGDRRNPSDSSEHVQQRPVIASNIRPVNSPALLVAIIQDVGRSNDLRHRSSPTTTRCTPPLFEPVSSNAIARHSCSALAAKLFAPNALGMVLAYPAEAKADGTMRVDHYETSTFPM